jgi:ribonucleoside-diphosphate reductase alpha chain
VYVTINYHDGIPVEVFIMHGKSGSDQRACTEALGRLCSVALQRGVSLRALTKQLRGISSETTMGLGPNKTLSVPDAVGRVFERFLEEE